MKTRIGLAVAAVIALVVATVPAGASSAHGRAAIRSAPATPGLVPGGPVPPPQQREAATAAAWQSVATAEAAGALKPDPAYPDPTGQIDMAAYGVDGMWKQGIDGAGTTVALINNGDAAMAARVDAKVATYSAQKALPPPSITDMSAPSTDPSAPCPVACAAAAGEMELDLEAVHSMAPFAHILNVYTSVPETAGIQGWPQMAQAVNEIAGRHLADVMSISYGDGEGAFNNDPLNPGSAQAAEVHSLDPALVNAASQGVPVFAASGDCGPTDVQVLFATGQCTPTLGQTAGHPVDSPWVTAVGGSIPNLAPNGQPLSSPNLWAVPNSDASGAGVSSLYPQPAWQHNIPALAGQKGRAYPDVTMDSSDGTSQASPTMAGIAALASQARNRDLGPINQALAGMGPAGAQSGLAPIGVGQSEAAFGVPGYSTGPAGQYSIAGGWGTVWAPSFVPALVQAVNKSGDQPSRQAAGELARLQRASSSTTAGKTVTVTGNGFIPGRTPNGTTLKYGAGPTPPIPGQQETDGTPAVAPSPTAPPGTPWDTLTYNLSGPGQNTANSPAVVVTPANGQGAVTVNIDGNQLAPGNYTLTLQGDVLQEKIPFTIK